MISTKKLISMARKWQNKAATTRKRIPKPQSVANEGHFVAYTNDKRRFLIPLSYLKSEIFIELLRIAEEEFGVPCIGPIMLPCDSSFIEYTISLIERSLAGELVKALLMSLTSCRYTSLSTQKHLEQTKSQYLLCSF